MLDTESIALSLRRMLPLYLVCTCSSFVACASAPNMQHENDVGQFFEEFAAESADLRTRGTPNDARAFVARFFGPDVNAYFASELRDDEAVLSMVRGCGTLSPISCFSSPAVSIGPAMETSKGNIYCITLHEKSLGQLGTLFNLSVLEQASTYKIEDIERLEDLSENGRFDFVNRIGDCQLGAFLDPRANLQLQGDF